MERFEAFKSVWLTVAVVLCMLLAAEPGLCINSQPTARQADELARLRQAGLMKDRSQIPALLTALKNQQEHFYRFTALRSLAQMGAVEALPKIEVIEKGNDFILVGFVRAAKARLIAENSVSTVSDDPLRARTLTSKFYEVLGLTPAEVNSGVSRYYDYLRTHPQGGDNGPAIPVEVYAMREVADMAYHGPYQNFASLPAVEQLTYALDYPSALKMRLAPLSQGERINTMIQELSKKKILGPNDGYEIQLLADEGLTASNAVAIKLQQIDKNREQYKGIGLAALFRALEGIGDQTQSITLAHFLHDSDGDVGYFARQAYENINGGLKREQVLDY